MRDDDRKCDKTPQEKDARRTRSFKSKGKEQLLTDAQAAPRCSRTRSTTSRVAQNNLILTNPSVGAALIAQSINSGPRSI